MTPRRLLQNAPWILLVAVALSQIYLSRVRHLLNPAKGGGFGLFSTVDKLENRIFRARLIGQGPETPVGPESPSDVAACRAAMALPTEGRLRSAALRFLDKEYPPSVEGVRVEVWKTTFDPATREVRRVKDRELTVTRTHDRAD